MRTSHWVDYSLKISQDLSLNHTCSLEERSVHLSHNPVSEGPSALPYPGALSNKMAPFFRQFQPLPCLPSLSCLIHISSLSTVLILKDWVSPILLLWPQTSPKAYQHCSVHRCWPKSRQMQSSWGRKSSTLKAVVQGCSLDSLSTVS